MTTIWPPEFAVQACRTAPFCIEIVTPYSTSRPFPLGSRPDAITVHVEGGSREVPVEDIPTLAARAETSSLSPAVSPEEGYDEAVGLSRNLSIEEALQNALGRLPHWRPQHPDDMLVVQVTAIEAWFGGIAGFNDVAVRVRQPKQTS